MNLCHNDNSVTHADLSEADAHGHAALLLTQSLIHRLVYNSTIDLAEAHNVVSIAIDVAEELSNDLPSRPASLDQSISLLCDIKYSLGESE